MSKKQKKSQPKPQNKKALTNKLKDAGIKPNAIEKNLAANDELLSKELIILAREIHAGNSLRQKFIAALLTGFGTVIGATLLVAIFIFILTQLASIEILRPVVESITNMVKTSYK